MGLFPPAGLGKFSAPQGPTSCAHELIGVCEMFRYRTSSVLCVRWASSPRASGHVWVTRGEVGLKGGYAPRVMTQTCHVLLSPRRDSFLALAAAATRRRDAATHALHHLSPRPLANATARRVRRATMPRDA